MTDFDQSGTAAAADNPTAAKRSILSRRRRRILVGILIVAAIPILIGVAFEGRRESRRKAMESTVEAAGGTVWFTIDDEDERTVAQFPLWTQERIERAFSRVESVLIPVGKNTDDCLRELADLGAQPESLFLECSDVTNAGLEHVAKLQSLRLLNLADTDVTQEGIQRLKDLDGLQSLILSHERIPQADHRSIEESLPQTKIRWDNPAAANNIPPRVPRQRPPAELL